MVGAELHRPVLPGPLPDRRRGDEGRLPDRALVLVRPAVPPRPERAAAQAGDDVWRIDFQLGWDADPTEEKKPETRDPAHPGDAGPGRRVRAGMGVGLPVRLPAHRPASATAACIFAGDAAHQVSPFGARGANTGVQDCRQPGAGSSSWCSTASRPRRCSTATTRSAPSRPTTTCCNSTRATDFITPKSRVSLRLRNAVLELAETEPFARPLVNSGRLSTPTPYLHSSLNTPDERTPLPAR